MERKKGIIICSVLLVGLFVVLLIKGKTVTKEPLPVETPTVSATPTEVPTATPGAKKKEKKKSKPTVTPAPTVTPSAKPKEKTVKKTTQKGLKEKPTVKPTATPVPTITFEITCKKILDRQDLWKPGIEEIIPENGIYYTGTRNYKKGTTVYDVLKEICNENGILLDSQYTPMYGTYYIQGIGNLYEFDCGGESGWKYSVNGKISGVGCSSYKVKPGDEIVFFYDYEI